MKLDNFQKCWVIESVCIKKIWIWTFFFLLFIKLCWMSYDFLGHTNTRGTLFLLRSKYNLPRMLFINYLLTNRQQIYINFFGLYFGQFKCETVSKYIIITTFVRRFILNIFLKLLCWLWLVIYVLKHRKKIVLLFRLCQP